MKPNQVQIPRPKLDPNERYLRHNLMGDNVWPTLKDPRPDFRWKTLLFRFRTYLGSYFGVVSFRLKSWDEVMTSTMRILYSNRRWKIGWSEVKKNNTQSKVKSFNLSRFNQESTLSFLAGCPKSHFLGWYSNFLVYWYLKLDNQVLSSTCLKDKLGWIWRADDPYCRTLFNVNLQSQISLPSLCLQMPWHPWRCVISI